MSWAKRGGDSGNSKRMGALRLGRAKSRIRHTLRIIRSRIAEMRIRIKHFDQRSGLSAKVSIERVSLILRTVPRMDGCATCSPTSIYECVATFS